MMRDSARRTTADIGCTKQILRTSGLVHGTGHLPTWPVCVALHRIVKRFWVIIACVKSRNSVYVGLI